MKTPTRSIPRASTRCVVALVAIVAVAVASLPATAAPRRPKSQADLSVNATGPASPVSVGEEATVEITLHNGGPSAANSVTLTLTLSGPASVVQASAMWSSCSGSGPVTCWRDQLPSGATETVVVRLRATDAGSITVDAVVDAVERDPVTDNNTASLTIAVLPGADLTVYSTSVSGTMAVFTHTVANGGPAAAKGVRARILASLASTVTPSRGTCVPGTTWTCDLGDLSDRQSVTIEVQQVIPGSPSIEVTPGGGLERETSARAYYGGGFSEASVTSTTPDPNRWNNRSIATVAPSSVGTSVVPCTLPVLRVIWGVCSHPF